MAQPKYTGNIQGRAKTKERYKLSKIQIILEV
jgi:hypothetical protein